MGDMSKRRSPEPKAPVVTPLRASDAHDVEFFKRRKDDDPSQEVPALAEMSMFPANVRARLLAVLRAVAAAPPTKFAGGGQWEAMHDDMSGYFEVRVRSGEMLYRVFCLLDTQAVSVKKPILAVIDAASKRNRTALAGTRYARVRRYGDEYKRPVIKDRKPQNIRSLATEADLIRYGFG